MVPAVLVKMKTMVRVLVMVMVTVVVMVVEVLGFNLNTARARVLVGKNQTFFGYSVALWADTAGEKRLVVGAPRGKNSTAGNQTLPLGNLHLCQASSTHCPAHLGLPTLSRQDTSAQTARWGDAISKQGIGFTEAIYTANNVRSKLVACAPRYSIAFPGPAMQPRGACYVLNDASVSDAFRIVSSLDFCYVVRGYCKNNDHSFTGFSMAGFSTALSKNQSLVFMGSPYAFFGQGAVVRRGSSKGRKSALALSKTYFEDKILDYSSEGWALEVGRFDGLTDMVAVSVPNTEVFDGMIKFYTEKLGPLPNLNQLGSDVGAKFGFSLASGDLDGDGATDLAVGAPLAPGAHGAPDAGKVYVYYAPGKTHPPRASPLVLEGQVNWGRFGQAVTSPGDLNLDGYEDLVVGAPSQEGGAVFVFNGGVEGLLPHPTQTIHASEFSPGLRGFGFSLNGGQDMDDNGYPDLIIGVPLSDTAVFLRSSPVVTLEGSVVFDPPVLPLEVKSCTISQEGMTTQGVVCFDLVVSLQYTAPNMSRPLEMDLEVQLDQHEGRLAFLDDHQTKLVVRRNVTSSGELSQTWRLPAYVKPGRPEWKIPVSATVNVSLRPLVKPLEDAEEDGSSEDPSQVLPPPPQEVPSVLNILNQTSFSSFARLACDNVSTCFSRPDLFLRAQAPSELMVGSGTLEVQVELFVLNDTSYSTRLEVTYPSALTFGQVSGQNYLPSCKASQGDHDYDSHTCWFAADLLKDEQVPLLFHFEYLPEALLDHILTSGTSEFNLHFNVSSESVDLDEEDNQVTITIPTVTQTDLYLIGSSFPDMVEGNVNGLAGLEDLTHPGDLASPGLLGPRVALAFSLTNHGPSPLLDAKMVLRLPLHLDNDGGLPLLYLLEPPSTSLGITCTSPPLNPRGFNFGSDGDGRKDIPEDVPTTDGDGQDIPEDVPTTDGDGQDIPEDISATPPAVLTDKYLPSTPAIVAPASQGQALESAPRRLRRQESGAPPTDSTTESGLTPPPPSAAAAAATAAATDGGIANNFTNRKMRRGREELTLTCDDVSCEVVTCDVSTLEVGRAVTVTMYGYVVIATLKLLKRPWVRLESLVSVVMAQKYSLVTGDLTNQTVTIQAKVVRKTIHLPLGITWWNWLLVFLISFLCILIMMGVLYKVGFFKRKRPPGDQLSIVSLKALEYSDQKEVPQGSDDLQGEAGERK